MINFAEVEKSVGELKEQLRQGEIDEQTLEERLLDMLDVAEDGYYWMLGHESGKWYRHDGVQWLLDNPGEMFVPLADIDKAEQTLADKWQAVNLGWFIAGLALIAVVSGIIYYSAL